MGKVIPNTYYRLKDGGTLSLHSSHVPASAVIEQEGFTVSHPDGTRGLGRAPFDTEEEAQAWCDAHPRFAGMSQY